MGVSEFPNVDKALDQQDYSQWGAADGALLDVGDDNDKLRKCAEHVASRGFNVKPSTIEDWIETARAFPPGTRISGVSYVVHRHFKETDDPPTRLQEFVDECAAKGVPPTLYRKDVSEGKPDRKTRRAKSSIKASVNPTEALRETVKDLVSEDPEFADAIMSDTGIRKALDDATVRASSRHAKKTLGGKGLKAKPTPRSHVVTFKDVFKTLDHGTEWERSTINLVEHDVHVSLSQDERNDWANALDAKVKRLAALVEIIRTGSSFTPSDADLESMLKSGE